MNAPGMSTLAGAATAGPLRVSVVILTRDEEANIADCMASCAWCDDIHVVDSNSTDRTCEIAESLGAKVHQHPFQSFGEQRNWAIDNLDHKHDWVFHLDADERFTPELVAEMQTVLADESALAGYYVPHNLMFMGRWLRYAEGGYPIYQMRLFHKARMRFRDFGHGQREATTGRIGMLSRPYLHFNFSKGLDDWIDKHNRYSALEASEAFAVLSGAKTDSHSAFGNTVERRRFFKAQVYPRLPGTWLGRFVWMYFLRYGFRDGRAGLHYCLLMSTYDLFTSLKLSELRRKAAGPTAETPHRVDAESVARAVRSTRFDRRTPRLAPASSAGSNGHAAAAPQPLTPARALPHASISIQKEESPWSMKEKIGRVSWMLAQALIFRLSFHNWYGWRRVVLRCFGAKIGQGVRIRPTARIEIPWNLDIGDDSSVGDHAILYSLGQIRIGRGATISQYAHLCAGTHDYTRASFPLVCPPIVIEDEVWIAADAFVGPNVRVGAKAIVGARATVVRDVPPGQIVGGNPARFIKDRVMHAAALAAGLP